MPWDQTHFPASMKNFPAPQRGKAIEIANALLRQGVEEGKAIRIAIVTARQWAERHGMSESAAGNRVIDDAD
jgi:uncharacterized protein YdaT